MTITFIACVVSLENKTVREDASFHLSMDLPQLPPEGMKIGAPFDPALLTVHSVGINPNGKKWWALCETKMQNHEKFLEFCSLLETSGWKTP